MRGAGGEGEIVKGNTRNEIRVDCERVNSEGRHGRTAVSTVLIATTQPGEK